MSRHLGVIPARGGSKELPRKNILPLGGTPTIAYSIGAALQSGVFGDEVYVVTDDDEIEEVAQEYGARTPHREPPEMGGDTISSTVPVLWLTDRLEEKGASYDWVWNLQPTSPLRTPADIQQAAAILEAGGSGGDFLASVTPIDPHYFHWALKENEKKSYELWFPEFLVDRSLLPEVYRPNGAIKVGRPAALAEQGSVFSPGLLVSPIPEHRSLHIRSAFDKKLAEFVLETYPEEFAWISR